jgi:LysR family transcriptional regulator, hydrogen peroxide-inducible genes activator
MELYQLRYFVAVAETGNFTKAASRCFISQPSLSQQIMNLEVEVGQPLFHRLGRSVALTDAGKVLLEHAYRILNDADNALRLLKEDPSRGHPVAVGAIPTVAHFFFPAVVAHCRANDIPVNISTLENFRPQILNSVLEGDIDLGIISLPLNEPRIVATPLFSEPLLLAVSTQHPLASADTITFPDLRDENFISLGDASSLAAQVRRITGDYDFEPRIVHRCAQVATVKTLTALGLGVSILPRSARSANDPAGLVYRKFSGAAPARDIALISHYRRHATRGTQLFIEAARTVVGPLQEAATTPPFRPPSRDRSSIAARRKP